MTTAHETEPLRHNIRLKHTAAISPRISVGRASHTTALTIEDRMGWLFGIVEAAFVLAALTFFLIAAFLAPAHHETLATLPSPRQTDLAIAVALATLSFVAALGAEMLRRKLRPTS